MSTSLCPNFHELLPEMAHKANIQAVPMVYRFINIFIVQSFELDTFQKEAVYHLEMGDSVFVRCAYFGQAKLL